MTAQKVHFFVSACCIDRKMYDNSNNFLFVMRLNPTQFSNTLPSQKCDDHQFIDSKAVIIKGIREY